MSLFSKILGKEKAEEEARKREEEERAEARKKLASHNVLEESAEIPEEEPELKEMGFDEKRWAVSAEETRRPKLKNKEAKAETVATKEGEGKEEGAKVEASEKAPEEVAGKEAEEVMEGQAEEEAEEEAVKAEIKEVKKPEPAPKATEVKKQYSEILNLATVRPLQIIRDFEPRMEIPGETLMPDKRIKQADLVRILNENPDVKYLDLSDCRWIEDFSIVGKLPQLEELSFSNCPQLENISFLANLRNLKVLNLGSTGIDDISALKHLTKLQVLNLKYNFIESLEPLKDLVDLRDLILWGCANIADLNALRNLTELRVLDLDSSTVRDIEAVKYFKHLDTLHLDNCRVPDLAPLKDIVSLRCFTMEVHMMMSDKMFRNLEKLTDLRTLIVNQRGINDISILRNMKKMVDLQLNHNCIVDVSPLAELTEIRKLHLSGNKGLVDISPLAKLTKMENFAAMGVGGKSAASNMKIADISVMRNWPNLEELYLSHNSVLRDLTPLEDMRQLCYLFLEYCLAVEDLYPIRNITSMGTIDLSRSPRISDISCLKHLTKLSTLHMDGTNVAPYALSDLKLLPSVWNTKFNESSNAGKYAHASLPRKRKMIKLRVKGEGNEGKK